jgi:hypothetical protein
MARNLANFISLLFRRNVRAHEDEHKSQRKRLKNIHSKSKWQNDNAKIGIRDCGDYDGPIDYFLRVAFLRRFVDVCSVGSAIVFFLAFSALCDFATTLASLAAAAASRASTMDLGSRMSAIDLSRLQVIILYTYRYIHFMSFT